MFAVACVLAERDVAGVKRGFVAQGRVLRDTCRAGFETPASTYIRGAKVRVECRSKVIGTTICCFEGTTDHTGTYNILVADEHENEICESVLISSPASRCKTALQGRERTQVFLTHNNGIASDTRYTNSLGFLKDSPLPVSAQLLQPMSNLKF
ncbi:hypothetical protein C4D60_Mb02t09210 [Musa balbisiana]|uniref:Pollen Ole e 1 allergen and extensin family protein n=1 Tax=Musa balbisiana TaxID=52838 RepID=A0A4S8IBP6_MUSBA|nr:hypothetical protein C4D60_Mb02t09210 [Musa balbisiana]